MMIFKTNTICPPETDTLVLYLSCEGAPVIQTLEMQEAFLQAFGNDAVDFSAGDVNAYRIRLNGKSVNLITAAVDFSAEEGLYNALRKATLKVGTLLNELKSETVFVEGLSDNVEILRQFSAALPLCDYAFDKYKISKADFKDKKIVVYDNKIVSHLDEGANLAQGILIARDLVNEPACVLTPAELASRVETFGTDYGFEVEIFDKDACENLGMHAFLTVSQASPNEPKLIVMRYRGADTSIPTQGVIGKGLCYDSGGLHLKPGASLETCKGDMAGAAAVIGAMCAISTNKLPVNVTAVVAACENMIDGTGYRNGDIIQTMAGKSVFVGSTDAEGRLTLADAITYMLHHENVDSIIELSTLTGSCANFFSDICCGVLTTDDTLFEKLNACSKFSCEKYWRLPYFEEYRKYIQSDVADLHNTSTNGAGGICAGLFLDSFREETPFMHLDIAGLTFAKSKKDGYPKGATGFGVKTVYHYLKGENN